ncbi:MAG: hypothetical protein B7Y39_07995 [Bdellovibrio sp. 28-41-41]|nr:MAG: hypothetical protein B7Y39_07995 [Bdellovibrio sp. 28-41-41]
MTNSAPKSKNPIYFIFATIMLDMIGIGLIIPVLPDVIRRFIADPGQVTENFGYFIAVYAVMQFVASPILGGFSDQFGRRPILLGSLLGAGIDYIFMALAPTLNLLFLGRIIAGLTGASMTVANSYIADISDDSNRSSNFGMIGAAFGIGFIAGPIIGGLLGQLSPQMPFYGAAVLNILNFLFGLFILPESLKKENRRVVNWRKLNPKFGWNSIQVGVSLSFVGLIYGMSQSLLTSKLVPKWGESKSLVIGIFFNAFGFLLYGIAPYGWMMYGIMVVSALQGLSMPCLQSIMTKKVDVRYQGELQGGLVSVGSVTAILSPLIYTHSFNWGSQSGEYILLGAPYFVASVFGLLLDDFDAENWRVD